MTEREMVLKWNVSHIALEEENPQKYALVFFFDVMVASMIFRQGNT